MRVRASSTYTASTRNTPPFPTYPTFSMQGNSRRNFSPSNVTRMPRGEKRRIVDDCQTTSISSNRINPGYLLKPSRFWPLTTTTTRLEDLVPLFESPFLASFRASRPPRPRLPSRTTPMSLHRSLSRSSNRTASAPFSYIYAHSTARWGLAPRTHVSLRWRAPAGVPLSSR